MNDATPLCPVARAPYDPTYDPLVDAHPGCGRDYAPTYWIATAGVPPSDDGPIMTDTDAEVVIVGAGYTGLSAAIHLAKEYGIRAVVLEANRVAWGCSTRNGGQAQISSGRLKRSQWIARWGLDVARQMHAEISEAFELFRDVLTWDGFDCDPQDGGHLYVAHNERSFATIAEDAELLRSTFGYDAQVIEASALRERYFDEKGACGALHEPDGIGIHAGKLAFAYQRLARKLGVTVHPGSPVTGWTTVGGTHHLVTPGGVVRAKTVALATAGYTPPSLHPLTRHRLMPILSNSIVTRPLTSAEKAACNFRTTMVLTDTRVLRHYYRLLPDDRLQIGSRSAITGAGAVDRKHLDGLKEGLFRKFPALRGIEVDYSWWGWVDVSHDMMPRIVQPEPAKRIFYAMGYGGNGVMYSAQAGRRLAQLVAGRTDNAFSLPIFRSPLPSHGILTPFRRIGQRLAYGWYHLKDEVL